MLTYKNALNSPHRLRIYLNNPSPVEGFKQMLLDVSKIAQGLQPAHETQDLSTLSNGTAQVGTITTSYYNPSYRKPMRFLAECSYFIELSADNELKFIPFGETECGQEILNATQASDSMNF
jgi:hypothetical protein